MPNQLSKFSGAARRAVTSKPVKSSAPALITGALIGAGLAAAWLAVRTQTAAAERSHPPEGKFVEVDGVRLHYLERGSGPALVLLHGNGVMAQDFQLSGLIDKLAQTHYVIAFDRPGFGYSDRPSSTDWTPEAQAQLFHRALQELKVDKPIVVGHSWGTLVALAMGLDYPEQVRALALLGGYYYPSLRIDAFLNSLAAVPVVGTLWRHTAAPLLGRLMWPLLSKQLFAPAPVAPGFRHLAPWMALRPSQLQAAAAENGLMVPAAKRLSRRYGELKMPVALLAGAGDKVISAEKNSARLHVELANSALDLPGGSGHMVHYNQADRIAEAIAKL